MPRVLAFRKNERQPANRPEDEQQHDEHADGEAVDLVGRDGAGALLAVRALHRDGRSAVTNKCQLRRDMKREKSIQKCGREEERKNNRGHED